MSLREAGLIVQYKGAGCEGSCSDLTPGALDPNSPSESSSNRSSKFTFARSVVDALDASSIVMSCDSGSDLTGSTCETFLDSSTDVDSGVIECGILGLIQSIFARVCESGW